MKNVFRLLFIFIIVMTTMAFVPANAATQAQIGGDSPVVFGENYTLFTGQTIKNLVVFGGNAVIMQDSTVSGDVLIFGGNLSISGTIKGDITAFGGNITVSDTGVVAGVINAVGGNRFISPNATVGGVTTDFSRFPFQIPNVVFPNESLNFGPGISVIFAVFLSLILAALAVLVALFLPVPTANVAKTITGEPIISGGVGILTIVVAPAIALVLLITILLIPLSLLFIIIFILTLIFGWIGMGMALGERMAGMFNVRWTAPVSAGIGTLALSLLASMVLGITGFSFWTLFCLGVPIILLLNMVSLGGVVSSRFGSQVYSTKIHPQPPVPPSPAPQASMTPLPPTPPAAGTGPTGPAPSEPPTPPQPPEPPAPMVPPSGETRAPGSE